MNDVNADRGMVEALPLSVLSFVVGALVLAHAWAVINARSVAAAAARAGSGAFVESTTAGAHQAAVAAANSSIDESRLRTQPWDVEISGPGERCRPITVRVSSTVPLIRLPWLGATGSVTVTAAHSKIVDPFRAGRSGVADCRG